MPTVDILANHAAADGTALEQNWGERLTTPLFAYDDSEIWQYRNTAWIATPKQNPPTDGEVDADNSSIVTDDECNTSRYVRLRIHSINGSVQFNTTHYVPPYTQVVTWMERGSGVTNFESMFRWSVDGAHVSNPRALLAVLCVGKVLTMERICPPQVALQLNHMLRSQFRVTAINSGMGSPISFTTVVSLHSDVCLTDWIAYNMRIPSQQVLRQCMTSACTLQVFIFT